MVAPAPRYRSRFRFVRAARGVRPGLRSLVSVMALFGCAASAEAPPEPPSWDGDWEGFVETVLSNGT
jgi:hypothetical protein